MDSDYLAWSNACEDAELSLTVVQYVGDRHPYLALRILGGQDGCPLRADDGYTTGDIRSATTTGMTCYSMSCGLRTRALGSWDGWLDGRSMFREHIADLWRRPDGSTDDAEFELNNYRLHAAYDSTVYYGQASRTHASVGALRGSTQRPPATLSRRRKRKKGAGAHLPAVSMTYKP